jgi:hypothetical protein
MECSGKAMPIEFRICHDRRLVQAEGHGTLTAREMFEYQREVWSRHDVAGYDELIDMSQVEHIAEPTSDRIKELASLAAAMDAPRIESKFAIVAPEDLAFGLGRMYETFRGLNQDSKKQVRVFRSLAEAVAFLDVQQDRLPQSPAFETVREADQPKLMPSREI